MFDDSYVTDPDNSSGDEGAYFGGKLYPEGEPWIRPIPAIQIESKENREALKIAVHGKDREVSYSVSQSVSQSVSPQLVGRLARV